MYIFLMKKMSVAAVLAAVFVSAVAIGGEGLHPLPIQAAARAAARAAREVVKNPGFLEPYGHIVTPLEERDVLWEDFKSDPTLTICSGFLWWGDRVVEKINDVSLFDVTPEFAQEVAADAEKAEKIFGVQQGDQVTVKITLEPKSVEL